MMFPREEQINALVGDAEYVEEARWRVFEDLEGELQGRNVLLMLGDRWTVLKGEDFRRMAQRILPQL